MADAARRAYEFSHDVGSASWEAESPAILLRVSHPTPDAALVDEASQDRLMLRNIEQGLSARYEFFPYTISARFDESEPISVVRLRMDFSSPVTMDHEPDGIIRVRDLQGKEVLSIIPSRPTDETGMAGPATELSIVGGATSWELSIVTDGEWLRDLSRVYPIRIPLDLSFSPPGGVGFAAIRAMALEDETILYRDTRPDSATQFHITLFDDPDFRREKQQYRGNPACGTVPLGVGDTRDLSQEDLQRYADGDGYETRTVWIRLIASKPIAPDVSVMYDVETPGLVDFIGQVAERWGSMGDLPIYRGSFVIHEESPPSFVDGMGNIHAYIVEHRVNDINARISVTKHETKDLPISIRVVGHRGTLNLGVGIVVYNPPIMRATITVLPGPGGASGVDTIQATVTVQQASGEYGYVYDPCIDFEGTWATYWAVADDDAEHIPAIRSTAAYHEGPYSIGYATGDTIPEASRTHVFEPQSGWLVNWPHQISNRTRTSDALIASADFTDLCFCFWYRNQPLPPPPGTEWYPIPLTWANHSTVEWGDGANGFIICDVILEDGASRVAVNRLMVLGSSHSSGHDSFPLPNDAPAYYVGRDNWTWNSNMGSGPTQPGGMIRYNDTLYHWYPGRPDRPYWEQRTDWPYAWLDTAGLNLNTTSLKEIRLQFSGHLCHTRSLTYPYEISEHPIPSSAISVDHLRLFKGLVLA